MEAFWILFLPAAGIVLVWFGITKLCDRYSDGR